MVDNSSKGGSARSVEDEWTDSVCCLRYEMVESHFNFLWAATPSLIVNGQGDTLYSISLSLLYFGLGPINL